MITVYGLQFLLMKQLLTKYNKAHSDFENNQKILEFKIRSTLANGFLSYTNLKNK